MLTLSAPWIFSIASLTAGLGYTLLNYSTDGDMDLRVNQKKKLKKRNIVSEDEAWNHLLVLINAESTEVTWNSSMFIALVSSQVFLGLLAFTRNKKVCASLWGLLWLTSVLCVFLLQDLVIRWKAAHRKSAAMFEKVSIIEQLRWSKTFATLPLNKIT